LDSVTIREARRDDALELSDLLTQLGYPTEAAQIPDRLDRLHARPGTIVLVAEVRGRPVGMGTVHLFSAMHCDEPAAWLTALVVDESARGMGVGSALVKRAEELAVQHGALNLALTSALHRKDAHEFYKHHGYEHTGVRLVKKIGEAATTSPTTQRT
jgi:GNAT superfamily N-acetyltransferase